VNRCEPIPPSPSLRFGTMSSAVSSFLSLPLLFERRGDAALVLPPGHLGIAQGTFQGLPDARQGLTAGLLAHLEIMVLEHDLDSPRDPANDDGRGHPRRAVLVLPLVQQLVEEGVRLLGLVVVKRGNAFVNAVAEQIFN
jgi:hypothetical protein